MNVLLVVKDPLVRMMLAEILAEAGMCVEAIADPFDALKSPEAIPDLMVTDINLGCAMDGFMLAAAAKLHWQFLRVVFISGRPDLFNGRPDRPDERFLTKPFTEAELLQAVGELMGMSGHAKGSTQPVSTERRVGSTPNGGAAHEAGAPGPDTALATWRALGVGLSGSG
jgi:two-component system, OmpR family, response regulator